jgi:hypothetical protein
MQADHCDAAGGGAKVNLAMACTLEALEKAGDLLRPFYRRFKTHLLFP